MGGLDLANTSLSRVVASVKCMMQKNMFKSQGQFNVSVSCQIFIRWFFVFFFYFSHQPIHPAGSNIVYMCMLISHWQFCMCVMLAMSCQSCWDIIMPKEGLRWILCWVLLFYYYYPSCQDEFLNAAAVYMVLMKLCNRHAFSCFSPSLQAHGWRRIGHPII